ncbi:MAG: tetratricopeptide repeat protein [Gemmatimonadaceae bacterium]|nr:tetratricopeptide repeat protein [Gemmatimonadaceae bacterium]
MPLVTRVGSWPLGAAEFKSCANHRERDGIQYVYLPPASLLYFQFFGGGNKAAYPKALAAFDNGFALVQKAQQLAPRDGAVLSVATGTYIELPASYGMAPQVIGMLEGMRKGMGPAWERFSHHGRQRLLLTLGRAYAQTGNTTKARANFDEALAINGTSTEAGLIKAEMEKLPGM